MIRYVKISIVLLLSCSSLLYAQKKDTSYSKENVPSYNLLDEDTLDSPIAIVDTNYFYTETDTLENVKIEKDLKGSALYNVGATFKVGGIRDKYELFGDYSELMFEISTGIYSSLALSLGVEYYYTNNLSLECAIGIYNSKMISRFNIYLPIIDDKDINTAHTINLNLLDYGLTFLGKYKLPKNFQVVAGVRFGYNLSASYDHHVKILSDEAIYLGDSEEKTIRDTKINAQGHFSTIFGSSYRMDFEDRKYNLIFSLSYENGFNMLEMLSRLRFYSFNVGVTLSY
jgi:hypothetical protein